MKSQVSFIIPAYNASNTIVRCLDSIYNLPLEEKDFEVIVIDDCSKDNTVQIIEQYSIQHTNLTLLRQADNHRQGAARNIGMKTAKGEYIMFVDADDEVVAEGITNALNAAKESTTDVCYFDFQYENTNGDWNIYPLPMNLKNSLVDANYYMDNFYNCMYNAPWRCLYKTSFLQEAGILFVEDVQFEDGDWTVKVYCAAKTIQFVNGCGYKYYWGENATSRQTNMKSIFQRILAGVRLLQIAENTDLPKLRNTLIEYVQHTSFSLLRFRNLTKYLFYDVKELLSMMSAAQHTYIHTYIHTRTLCGKNRFWQSIIGLQRVFCSLLAQSLQLGVKL